MELVARGFEASAKKQQGSYPCFTNVDCPYFPCHDDVDPAIFNCLFCYCPLYPLGAECGGDFTYTEMGYKDCSACSLPHAGDAGTRLVMRNYPLLASMAFDPDAARLSRVAEERIAS